MPSTDGARHGRARRRVTFAASLAASLGVAWLTWAASDDSSTRLEDDVAALESALDGLSAPRGATGEAGPSGEPGPEGPAGPAGQTLTQQQVVDLAQRTEALEKRARDAALRLEKLDATLRALHAVTDKVAADVTTLGEGSAP